MTYKAGTSSFIDEFLTRQCDGQSEGMTTEQIRSLPSTPQTLLAALIDSIEAECTCCDVCYCRVFLSELGRLKIRMAQARG